MLQRHNDGASSSLRHTHVWHCRRLARIDSASTERSLVKRKGCLKDEKVARKWVFTPGYPFLFQQLFFQDFLQNSRHQHVVNFMFFWSSLRSVRLFYLSDCPAFIVSIVVNYALEHCLEQSLYRRRRISESAFEDPHATRALIVSFSRRPK